VDDRAFAAPGRPASGFAHYLRDLVYGDGISMGASNYLGLKSELEQSGRDVRGEARTPGAGLTAGLLAPQVIGRGIDNYRT
jgi:hypothetical protein